MNVAEIATGLEERHGANPQEIGAADGTEDDYGDLLTDAWQSLGWPENEYGEDWQHFQAVAANCQATTMEAWVAHLAAITKDEVPS